LPATFPAANLPVMSHSTVAPLDGLESAAVVEAAAAPLTVGNRVRVLRDGDETLPAMFAAIRAARRYILLEYYVLEDVRSEGTSLFELLVDRSKAGVDIAMIYDALGSSGTPAAAFQILRNHGIRLLQFNPINPFSVHRRFHLNRRDHRKILITDRGVAFVGGVNMSSVYQAEPSTPRRWRDTDLQLEGPAVAQLHRLFLDQWVRHGGDPLGDIASSPPRARPGEERVGIIGSAGSKAQPRYYGVLLKALRAARLRVWMTAGYFLPTAAVLQELSRAAQRHVDVQLLLPSHNDSIAALAVQRSAYSRLLDSGVRIWERDTVILHSKSMIVDECWSVVGSSNLDRRSMLLNDEVDAIVVGSETARTLSQLFVDDVSQAQAIEPAAWRRRPMTQKAQEVFWRLWQRFL
jgi:cardiolipin synthase A/B